MNKMNSKRNKNKCPSSNTNDKSVGSSSSKCILSEKVPERLELKNGLVKITNDVSKEKTHNRKSKKNKLKSPNINGDSIDQKKQLEPEACLEQSSAETVNEREKNETTCPLHNIIYQTTDNEKKKNETDYPNGGIEYPCVCEQYHESIKIDNSPLYLMFLPQKAQDGANPCSSSTTIGKPVYSEISKVKTDLEDHTTSNENMLKVCGEIKQTIKVSNVDSCYSSTLPLGNGTETSNCQTFTETSKSQYGSYPNLLLSGPNSNLIKETPSFETYSEKLSKVMRNLIEESSASCSFTSLECCSEGTSQEKLDAFVRKGSNFNSTFPCDRYPTNLTTDIPDFTENPKQGSSNLELFTKESVDCNQDDSSVCDSFLPQENVESLTTVANLEETMSNIRLSSGDREISESHTVPELKPKIEFVQYESELQMPMIMKIIQKDLSEPYSIYTYRYFIHNWPKLCFLVSYPYCLFVFIYLFGTYI